MAKQVKEFNPNYKWTVLAMVVVVYVFTYAYAMTSLSALLTQISKELSLDVVQQAAVIGALPIGIACFTFVVGVLLDKMSTRILMAIAVVICGVAILMRGTITSFGGFYAVMFILGIGQAIVFPGANKVVSMWFKREEIFKASGIVISGAPIGMIVGFNFAIPLSKAMGGWQNMYMLVGAITIVVAVIWLIVAKDIPADKQELNKALGIDTEKNSVLDNLKAVLGKKQLWFVCLAEFFFQGMMQTVIAFGASVLMAFPGATAQIAGTTSSMGNIGSLFGYYILPPISERYGVKKPFIWPSMLIYGILMPIGLFSKNFIICGACFFIASFFNGWSVPGGKSMLLETPGIAGLRSGTAIGFMVTMQRAAAAIFPLIYAGVSLVIGNTLTSLTIICLVGSVIASVFIIVAKETGIGRAAAKKLWEEKKAAKMAAKK